MGKMQKLSGVRSLEGLRSLVGSTSTAMEATNPTDAGVSSYGSFANLKITAEQLTSQIDVAKANVSVTRIKLRRVTRELKVLEGKLEQAVNKNAKLKVKENGDLKLWQGLDSKISSTETLCDQLTETLQQLASQTEQAEEDKKCFEEMLGKYSKALEEINLLLHDLSKELVDEIHGIMSGKEEASPIRNDKEEIGRSYSGILHSNDSTIKEKETLVKEQASSKSNQELLHTKLRREKIIILERKLQQAVNEKEKIKAKQIEIAKLWQGLDLKISSAKTVSDQLTETLCHVDNPAERDSTAKQFEGSIEENKASLNYTQSSEHELKAKRTTRSFHSTSFTSNSKKKKMSRTHPINNAPGNHATIVLDGDDLKASRRSYRRGIKKARAWCRANDTPVDLSGSGDFEPGDEVYRTPEDGTFHLTFEYRNRRITFFIFGRDLYLKGWETDKYGKFEMKADDLSTRFIQDLACTVLRISENYNHLVQKEGGLSKVRIGPIAMMNSFDVVHKSKHVSTALIDAVTVFAVNTSEAIRIECILEEISEAFINFNITTLGEFLAFLVRSYGQYSKVYLKCIDHILRGLPVPIIENHPELEKFLPGKEIRSVHDLRRIIKVPLRTAYTYGKFKYDKNKIKPAIWSPPYPDGSDWVCEEEDEVEEQKLEWSPPYTDGSDCVCEEEEDVQGQQLEQEEEDENKEEHEPEEDEDQGQEEDEEQGQEEDEEENHVLHEEKDVRDYQIQFYRKIDGVLKMTSNLSRLAEAASTGGISNIRQYGFFATAPTCKASTTGHRLAFATSAGMMTARDVKSGRSIAYSMFRYASKATKLLHRIL